MTDDERRIEHRLPLRGRDVARRRAGKGDSDGEGGEGGVQKPHAIDTAGVCAGFGEIVVTASATAPAAARCPIRLATGRPGPWVLTFPFPWRRRLAQDGALFGVLTRLFVESVERFYEERAARRGACGAAATGSPERRSPASDTGPSRRSRCSAPSRPLAGRRRAARGHGVADHEETASRRAASDVQRDFKIPTGGVKQDIVAHGRSIS
ncbi:hypothetical protein [Sorangium sp. So ce1099]|uniref:hypothetical protein n=1 Tax=Sorangium sp. So ce1099 TaxID=3133331 RepID=UPI003F6099DC